MIRRTTNPRSTTDSDTRSNGPEKRSSRHRHRTPLLNVLGVIAASLLSTTPAAETYSPQVGQRHVNFTLPAIDDGRPLSLEQFRGQKVLLIQFASW